jgi:MFS family permease
VGLSSAQWGLVVSTITVVNLVLRLIFAPISDKRGRTRFIFVCFLGWPITFFLYSLTGNFLQVIMVRVAIDVVSGIGASAWEALFFDYSPKEHRGRFNAIASTAWSLVWGFGNMIGGILYQYLNIRSPFYVASIVMAVAGMIGIFIIKEPNNREN